MKVKVMRTHPAPGLLAVAIAIAACGGGSAAPTSGSGVEPGGSSPASPGSTGAAVPSAPLVITGQPDEAAAAEGVVTLAGGGSVTATASDGSMFELVVPAGAVPADTTIRLTPLSNARVMDGAGPLYAVRLEPDGLQFTGLARLTITPSTPIPVEQQLALTAAGDGSDVELAIVDPTSEPAVLLLEHFSEGGLGQFTSEQQAVMKAASATNAENRISGEIRALLQEERQRQLLGEPPSDLTEALQALLDEFIREVLEKRAEAAALSCEQLYAYVKSLLSFERQVQLLGFGTDQTYAAAVEAAHEILVQRYSQCEREAKDRCIKAKDPAILIHFWLANSELGVQVAIPTPPEMQKKAEQICRPQGYQFHFEGSGMGDFNGFDEPIEWQYWGLLCPKAEEWQVWEMVHSTAGTESTGDPEHAAYGPLAVTFDDNGRMDSASWAPLGNSPAGYLLHKTLLSISPPDAPTSVTAVINAGRKDLSVDAPVEPYDGSFGTCEEAASP